MRATENAVTAVLLALALAAVGCGGQAPVAATVNGERVPTSAVDRELADIAANEPFLEMRRREGASFRGTAAGSYDAVAVADLLNRRVTATLVHQALERRGLRIGRADLTAARDVLRREVVDPDSGASLLDGFPDRYVEEQARTRAESDLLQADEGGVSLDEPALRAAYDASLDRYRVWCVRWIVFATDDDGPERAAAARAAIAAGEDFGQVAVRQSADPGSAGRGGALGCQTREGLARLGDAFRDVSVPLAPGQVSPVTTSSVGTFLVEATDVKVRPFDEVRGNVRAAVLGSVAERYDQLLRRLRREAVVSVSARFGTWDRSDPDAITIVPPGGRPTTVPSAPAPSAVGP